MKLEKEALFQRFWKSTIWNTRGVQFLKGTTNNWFDDYWGGINTESGVSVSVEAAQKLTVVYSSINIISQTIGAFPFVTKQKTKEGKFDATTNSVYTLLKNRPNRFMTAMSFWMLVVKHLLARGNSFALIEKDKFGNVTNLIPLDPIRVEIQMFENEIFYRDTETNVSFAPEEVLHFRMDTKDGVVGISPIEQNAEIMGAHLKQNKYAIKVLGEKPPGYLTDKTGMGTGGARGKSNAEGNIEQWKRQISEKGIPYLTGDIGYVQLMIPPDEAQYLQTRKLTNLQILSIYRTPPELHQIYEDSNNSLNEGTAINFGKYCLTPIVTAIEQECNGKLFGGKNLTAEEPFFVKANMNSLYRSDLKTTSEYFKTMSGAGIYNADDCLDLLDENRQPDGQGQVYYIQAGFMPKSQSEEFWASKSAEIPKEPDEKDDTKMTSADAMDIYIKLKNKENGE